MRRRTLHGFSGFLFQDYPPIHRTVADDMLAALVFEDIARPNATIEIEF